MFSVFSVNLLSSSFSLDVSGKKNTVQVFSWPKPFSCHTSDLAHSVGLSEGHFSPWSKMWGRMPCPLRHSPHSTGCNHMLFRWHREAQNAFIQITRFEVSSLMNTSNLHEAILFSQHEGSPVVLYYYYFFLFHPLHKLPSANYHGSCFPPAGRLIAVNSSLWSPSQLVLQQVTRKPSLI